MRQLQLTKYLIQKRFYNILKYKKKLIRKRNHIGA